MHIQCPKCKITYNVSDSLINSAAPTFRCSRCKHTFVLELKRENKPARKIPSSPVKQPPENEEDRELTFSFDQPQSDPPQEHPKADNSGTQPSLVGHSKSNIENAEKVPVDDDKTNWSLPQLDEDRTADFPNAKATPQPLPSQSQPEFEKDWWAPPKQVDEKQPAIQFSTAPFLGLFLGLLVLYSLLVLNHTSRPAGLENFLRLIPGMEWVVFRNNHLKERIDVESVTQKVQFIRGNREVFTISGLVVNRNAVNVREVRLEGYLFNGEGKEIGRQQISVGNPISVNLIGAVEAGDISILQEIGPQKRFTISPDESAPFVIVFLKPAKEIKTFAYRVLSAEEVS